MKHFRTLVHSLLVVALMLPLFSSGVLASAAVPAQSSNPLRGYWQFEQNLTDSSPNHNDGASTAPIIYASGIVGSALSRDGTQPSITLPHFGNNNSLNLDNSAITIEAWVKSSNFGDDFRHLIDNVDGYALSIFEGRLAMLGPDFWWTPISTTGPNNAPLTNPLLSLGTWHYVAGTYDGSKQALYVDGQLVAYRTTSAGVPSGQGNIGIAGYGGGGLDYAFKGLIDELRVFDFARSAAAIAADYADLTSSSPVRIRITDSVGNPVSGLSLNSEVWPVLNTLDATTIANPLTVKVAINQGTLAARYMRLDIYDPSGRSRFYVSGYPLVAVCSPQDEQIELFSPENTSSYRSFSGKCDFQVLANFPQYFEWQVWVQPSESTQLNFKITTGDSSQAERSILVPQASIYPIVFIPGLGATNPPQYNLDYHNTRLVDRLLWLANTDVGGNYQKLYDALERLGYERNRTYFLFPYDWLANVVFSAERLRDDLLIPASAEIAATVPWVKGYGSPNGSDVAFDLMGHSTGNLVARAYMQVDSDSEGHSMWVGHVHRFVSLAGPHKGLPKGFALFEGVSNEGGLGNVCITKNDIACLAFYYSAPRAKKAGYGDVKCKPIITWEIGCVLRWPMESRYLYIHDPLADARGPGSATGFLPTYNEIAYLMNQAGNFPYGRVANPLLEDETIRGSNSDANYVYDPFMDNPYAMANLRQRYPDRIAGYQTTYFGLNTTQRQRLLTEYTIPSLDRIMCV